MELEFLPGKGSWCLGLLVGVLMLTALGCGGVSVNPAVSMEQMSSEPSSQQVLAPGDVVEIKFLYNSELNDTQRVRPDGMITLPIIGEATAQGKDLNALQGELNKAYAAQLRKPAVTLTAKTLRNNKVYVGGEVIKPGEIEIPGRLTAFEAIGQAGGFKTDTAETSTVVVIRTRDGKHYGTALNLKQALSGAETQPFYLRPGDVVFVPQTRIAKVNQWVEQHINKMLPRVPIAMGAGL
ncbi:MAG: polysaccharide biosynthesis/export family protein [Deltaproteobacteria bacterium]|nr:polysaccharide biosynthesis/export family protein [Deltaproteobacteria bacterium]